MTTTLRGEKFEWLCGRESCTNVANMMCPQCDKVGLPPVYFCSQECFKKDWKVHNQEHKRAKAYQVPSFSYTGPLRPAYVTTMRSVPNHIMKPDYALTGEPVSEKKQRQATTIPIYTPEQIEGVREACRIGRLVLDFASSLVRPGITTEEIDRALHQKTIELGAYPSPLNYYNFPKSFCSSVNEVICHGIPDCRPLQDGDIVNLDISVYYKGYHGDLNETHCVGTVDESSKQLIKAAYESLQAGIEAARPGVMVRELGSVITAVARKYGYQVVRTYCGHGIGELFHCQPNVPHYAHNKAIGVLKPGMIFTIEPMINAGHWRDKTWAFDNWTAATVDGQRSAQFEHTMVVTETGVEVLTARTADSVPLWWEQDAAAKKSSSKKKKKKKRKKKKTTTTTTDSNGDEKDDDDDNDDDDNNNNNDDDDDNNNEEEDEESKE